MKFPFRTIIVVIAACVFGSLIFHEQLRKFASVAIGNWHQSSYEERLLSEPLRTTTAFSGFAEWTVVDAFPETGDLWGAMQMRPHPERDNCWYLLNNVGYVYELTRLPAGLNIRRVVNIRSDTIEHVVSFALHPKFGHESESRNKIYIFYLANDSQGEFFYRVSEFALTDSGPAISKGEHVILEQALDTDEHLGGALEFDEHGFLLISVGDNGITLDEEDRAQDYDGALLSGVLRIDVEKQGTPISFAPGTAPAGVRQRDYFIPSDNPFVDRPEVHDEFWAFGLRNPFRMSYDMQRTELWIGEVGQGRMEQVEVASAGTNHQWSFREGSLPFADSRLKGQAPDPLIGRSTLPYYEYPHRDQDYCIIGGLIYRGTLFPELTGYYLYGDNQSSRIFALHPDNPKDKRKLLELPQGKSSAHLTSISTDANGRIFFTHISSGRARASVHELVRGERQTLPETLSDTGFFTNLQPLTPSADFVAYDVNSPLWSDGMNKDRWIRLPVGAKIDNNTDPWVFPEGTTLIKHFANPADRERPIETRILMIGPADTVFGASYVWDESGLDATLSLTRQTIDLKAVPPEAGIGDDNVLSYRIPSSNDCLACHNPDNRVLGVNKLQLTKPQSDSSNLLRDWYSAGMFTALPVEHDLNPEIPLVALNDLEATIQARARSYLHSNCSLCHHPNYMKRTKFDARITTSLDKAMMIGERAHTDYVLIDGRTSEAIIDPGSPESSAMYQRVTTLDDEHSMPYLGRRSVHLEAASVLREWIDNMQTQESK